jgi:hypothetical protein
MSGDDEVAQRKLKMARRSFPIAIIVATLLSLSPVGIPLSDMAQITAAQDVGEVLDLMPGVTVTVLASGGVDSLPDQGGGIRVVLDRVSLLPGMTMSEVVADLAAQPGAPPEFGAAEGPHLLYVDAGEITLLDDGAETTYRQEQQVVLPIEASFDVRNDTSSCASFLLLTIGAGGFAGGFGAEIAGPVLPTLGDCPPSRRMIDWHGEPNLPGRSRLFLARVTSDPASYDLASPWNHFGHSGPVGLVVETGTLNFRGGIGVETFLAPGSSLRIRAETPYILITGEPTTALLAGVVPEDKPLFSPLNFVSRAYGVRFFWEGPWEITGESWARDGESQSGWLRLENRRTQSQVHFEEFAGFGGNSVQCLDNFIDRLSAEPTVANLHPDRQNGRAIEERDVTRAYAEYVYDLTDGNGSTQEFVAHIECRTLVPDAAVIVIHAYMPRTDLDVQRQDLEELLAGLVLP